MGNNSSRVFLGQAALSFCLGLGLSDIAHKMGQLD